MTKQFPTNIDIDQIYYLISLVRWHRDMHHSFCKETVTVEGSECVYAVGNGERHMIGHVNVLDEIERFVKWVDRLETAGN